MTVVKPSFSPTLGRVALRSSFLGQPRASFFQTRRMGVVSGHLRGMQRRELARAALPQGLVRTGLVAPLDPRADGRPCLSKVVKLMVPDTLFFETPEKAFNHPGLLLGVRPDEFLVQPVVAARCTEPATLKDQAIVTTQYRGANTRSQRAKRRRQAASITHQSQRP